MKKFCQECVTEAADSIAGTLQAHRWRIEEANGPTVLGVCQRCGVEREFSTTGPDEIPKSRQWSLARKQKKGAA